MRRNEDRIGLSDRAVGLLFLIMSGALVVGFLGYLVVRSRLVSLVERLVP